MTSNINTDRALQQDARAWSAFTGTKYTAALRQMISPMAQGLLGQRISARLLIATLGDHALIGAEGSDPGLGENGFRDGSAWVFDGKTDYVQLALIADALRMFTSIEGGSSPAVDSYSLKRTVERLLEAHCPHVSNGRLIWAAAALGLPLADPDGTGLNLLVGVSEREHDYVRRLGEASQIQPRADHYRPPGYDRLRSALAQAAAGELITEAWVRPVPTQEPAPFHDWLSRQVGRDDVVGDFAGDYVAGIRDSDHVIARTADDLVALFHEISHSLVAYDALVTCIAEWMRTDPLAVPVRTERIGGDSYDTEGWGAGVGSVERYEFICPCGSGVIIEEHDNTPGFREHDHWIRCDKCRAEWRFVEGRSVRDWAIEPARP